MAESVDALFCGRGCENGSDGAVRDALRVFLHARVRAWSVLGCDFFSYCDDTRGRRSCGSCAVCASVNANGFCLAHEKVTANGVSYRTATDSALCSFDSIFLVRSVVPSTAILTVFVRVTVSYVSCEALWVSCWR